MINQYRAAKERHPGMLLLFRAGNTYECFGQDATDLQALCGTTLTGTGDDAKSGFAQDELEQHLRKLLQNGKRVAVCDHDEQPAKKAERTNTSEARTAPLLF